MPITFTPEPGSISPPLDLLPKDVIPNAREVYTAQNPMSQFKEVEPNLVDAGGAKKIDLNARERLGGFRSPMAQFKEVEDRTLPGFNEADDLDVKTVEQLYTDKKNFDPVDYFASNPNAANDPAKVKKLLDVYRKRREEGLTASGVISAAKKNTPGLLADFAGGVKRVGERVIDVGIQPTANVILGSLTGDLVDKQKRDAIFSETRKIVKKGVAEGLAGSEANTVGVIDLSRQGLRKVKPLDEGVFFNPTGGGSFYRPKSEDLKPIKNEKTDQELLAELSDDASFRQNAADILKGGGEGLKQFGLDKDTLAKEGIELDENAIAQLSLVDPLNLVAGAGVFKVVGLAGKVLATARTLEGAQAFTEKLTKFTKASVGRSIQGVGKLTTLTGKQISRGTGIPTIAGVSAAMSGSGGIESVATGLAVRAAGSGAKIIGPKIEALGAGIAEGTSSAGVQRVIDFVEEGAKATAKVGEGAALGVAAGAPFALAADEDETAGTLLGVSGALGAVSGAGAVGAKAFRVVKNKAARRYFDANRPVLENVESPGYGKDAALDAQHDVNIRKFSMQDTAELNNFREALRQQGGEIYVVDGNTFRQKIADAIPNLAPEKLDKAAGHLAYFDETAGPDRKIVYLNSSMKGLTHDAGHIFDAVLAPEKQKELRDAVRKTFTQEQINEFKKTYENALGNTISDETAISEFVAEQFSALFNNVPVTELNAPKSLLSKFIDVAAEGAEALGIDLTGSATSPNLGAPVSVGIRKLFQNAAGEVTKANIEGTPSSVVAFPGAEATITPTPPATPEPPAPTTPTSPIPDVTRPTVSPISDVTPNIRVSRTQQDAFSNRNSETGVARARELAAADKDPAVATRVDEISKSLESGNPVLEISHLGITSETPAAGREARVGEQTAGYTELDRLQIDSRAEAPASIVNTHQKTFVPVRWTNQGGTPTLLAMSLDKVISNVNRVAKESVGKGVDTIIPYAMENGKFTDAAWTKIIEDTKAYGENHSNGYRGDGKKLVRPGVDVGLSIPAENPNYTPKILSEEVMNFQNLIQGLNTPATAREVRGQIPRNVKNQVLAQANKRTLLEPASIRPRDVGKQAFVSFPGKTVKEVNPMRNELVAKGVDIGSLIPVTEQIRAKDITSVKPRSDLNFKAPVTDIVGGGFLPSPEEVSQIKAALLESQKVGDLDFKTFMSAFRDKYFLDWQDHPSFEEITQKFPNSDLKEAYEAMRKEFNGYFKYDNEQAALKFKEAAGDPQKESAAADFAARQWRDTSEQLDSRLYALLRDEPKVLRPKDVVRTTYWLSPEGEIYEERYPHAMGDYFTRANLNLPKEKALEAGWAQVSVGEAPVEGAGLVSVESTKISPPQKFALDRISKSVGMEVVSKSGESVAGGGVPVKPTGITQKSLETVDWSEIRRNLQEKDSKNVGSEFGTGGDIYQVEDIIESLILNPEKSPNSFPKQHQQALRELLKLGRKQLLERGESPGLFLPATEFRRKNLAGKTVEEFSDYVMKSSVEEWKAATDNFTGGLTGGAWSLGLSLKEAGDVGVLKTFQEKLSTATKEAMQAGDFDAAYSLISKGQFFREAWEAATGSGSAGAAFKRGAMGTEGVKVPFPQEPKK